MGKRLKQLAQGVDEDVWYWIFNHCSLRDCIRMGAVCKSWLSVSKWSLRSRPPQLPWLMMLSNVNYIAPIVEEEESRCFISLSDNTIYQAIKFPEINGKLCCGSFNNADARARGWLMMIDEDNFQIQLFHPWRRIQLQLPNHRSHFQRLYEFHFYSFPYSPHPILVHKIHIMKAAMSDDTSVVVILLQSGDLAFCISTDGDYKVWTRITSFNMYCDVTYHNGKFYAITFNGGVGVLRINTTHPYVEALTEDKTIKASVYIRTCLLGDSSTLGTASGF
ncbi:hypothetical protein MRB53_026649 [Persea americana]|uniref:Uncharacterized protein n=1 Tax=Persea americana TaxID=3435 RepID=A0ACC2LJK5_PERAE|nr:hypothetical protein MRB53_026649 [Persea americana]